MFRKTNLFRRELSVVLFFLTIIIFFLFSYEANENNIPEALQGKIDLSKCNFEENGLVKLDGQWELYWGELLVPVDFRDSYQNEPVDYFTIPNSLETTVNNNDLPKFGYSTMRLVMKMPNNQDRIYGIKTGYMLSASKIWINGKLVTSAGEVSKDVDNAIGSFQHQIAFFENNYNNEVEIVIQTSNFNNVTGKIGSIYLGNESQIKREYIMSVVSDAFIMGALFIMAIYHFALYYKRPKYKATLYFGGFCLITALRNALVGERIIFEVFPNISFDLFYKMAYLTVYFAFPFIVMFFKELFPKNLSLKMIHTMNVVSLLISLITIFSNIEVYDKFLIYYEMWIVILFIYIMFIIIKGVINKNQGSLIILFGFIVFVTATVHDIFVQAGVLHARSLFPFGFFIFIFSQSYILAARFSDAFNENEKLIEENKAVYLDELTGILNRRGFYKQGGDLFKAALITGGKFTLFYADLNKFKNINDSFGHKEGDEAIKLAACLIKNSFKNDDIVARMSGDEFVAIAFNKASEEEAEKIIEKIKTNFYIYNLNSKKPYKLSISVGYSIYMPNIATDFEELIQKADSMLYDRKIINKNIYSNG